MPLKRPTTRAACRGLVFGGGITPDLTAPPYFEAPKIIKKMGIFMLIILFSKFIFSLPGLANSLPSQVK